MTGTVKAGADLFHANRTPERRRARSIAANAGQKSIDAESTSTTIEPVETDGTLDAGRSLFARLHPARKQEQDTL